MANGAPGPGGTQASPAGGKILHKVGKLTEEEEAAARQEGETQAGLRCSGCGERVSHGFEFVAIDVAKIDGRILSNWAVVTACTRKECDFAAQMAEGAVAMREVRQRFIDTPEMRALMKGVVEKSKGGPPREVPSGG